MKVLYVHQYFNTPEGGGSLRSYYLARELVTNGFKVTMITTHNQPHRLRKLVEGIDVIYLPIAYVNQMKFAQRGRAFIKFMFWAMFESTRHRQIDLCYVMTTPLSTGLIALFNKYILRRPYIFEVGDLWPQVPIDMGLLKTKWKQKLLRSFERSFYKNAKGLVGLSDPITKHLQKLAPAIPTQTIFNISDCKQFSFSKKEEVWIEKYKVRDQFVISYTGAFGIANDLRQVIDLAQEVVDLPIQFLLVGEGAQKAKMQKLVADNGLKNTHIHNTMSKAQLKEIINIADAMLVSFAPIESLHTGSPNKFFDALAAGKLVVANFRGWLGELIERESCGIVADSPAAFRQKIEFFLKDKIRLESHQASARKLAEERFDLKIQSRKQQEFISLLFS